MHQLAFCFRCRDMRVGWNPRYILHSLICEQWLSNSSKLLILTVLLWVLVFPFQPSSFPIPDPERAIVETRVQIAGVAPPVDPAINAINSLLEIYKVDDGWRGRIAKAIVHSCRKYNLDPRLAVSIMIVESRANPFAISNGDSIGIMQIHLPTWGFTADREGINLFKVEDNVDFGVRILKDYVRRFGLWEGVKHYKGWNADDPDSTQAAEGYLAKVQQIYAAEKQALTE